MNTEEIINKFIEDFLKIKNEGFIESHRSHNTGIGKTFEDLIGVAENNSQMNDYMNLIEIKSQRKKAESYITLFTKSPTNPVNANKILKESYGYPDSKFPSVKILHTSIFYNEYNNCKGKYGFKLELENDKLVLLIKDLNDLKIVSNEIYWNFKTLQEIVNTKCSIIAFISADTKKSGDKEFFHFTKCNLLFNFTFDKFLKAIKNNDIMFNIRIGSYKTGDKIGFPHDHGSGFRIHKTNLNKYFDIKEIF